MDKEKKRKLWIKSSVRLRELMQLRKVKQADLIRYVNKKTGFNSLANSNMSNYANPTGKRGMTREHIMLFSEYMDTMPGYLFGDDNYKCKSYAEYTARLKKKYL